MLDLLLPLLGSLFFLVLCFTSLAMYIVWVFAVTFYLLGDSLVRWVIRCFRR